MQHTRISATIRRLHDALMRIVAVMNRPQVDAQMVREAGIALDRALFPLLAGIERLGPIGVVALADRVGRDHTTVSRQVARLDALGLITRHAGADDGRMREAVVTAKGRRMTDAVDAARERLGRAIFANWEAGEVETLVRLLQRFADGVEAVVPGDPVAAPARARARADPPGD